MATNNLTISHDGLMVKIDLEKQPEIKEKKPPQPAAKPKLTLTQLTIQLLIKVIVTSLTYLKSFIVTTFTYLKSFIVKMAEEERVHPSPQNPSDESNDKPKKGGKSKLVLILKIIAALILIIAIVNFILWLAINPRKMKFYVTNAKLSEFTLSEDHTLQYSLSLNFTIRNPNKRIGFNYESIVGGAYYHGEKFDSGNLLTFHQPPKTTSGLDTWFSGVKKLSTLDSDGIEEFKEEKGSGVYPIDVKIRVYNSIKLGKIHIGDFKVKIKCSLKVPILVGDVYNNGGFKTTQCHVDFNPLIVIYSD